MSHIKKNDKVKVLAGKEKGRQGKVLKIFKEKDAALVERLNFVKRHTRAGGSSRPTRRHHRKGSPHKTFKVDAGLSQVLQTHKDGRQNSR